ncbi:unnamed protein product [Prorocentrum cordatum]|uniref:Uncharacterized protein n=1 Tax=Prorocentrum cordatum TaxID=2364126 RepID=A0ABN9RW03_9DINO|nr:unnamed protein product [Polarella glacialis]
MVATASPAALTSSPAWPSSESLQTMASPREVRCRSHGPPASTSWRRRLQGIYADHHRALHHLRGAVQWEQLAGRPEHRGEHPQGRAHVLRPRRLDQGGAVVYLGRPKDTAIAQTSPGARSDQDFEANPAVATNATKEAHEGESKGDT